MRDSTQVEGLQVTQDVFLKYRALAQKLYKLQADTGAVLSAISEAQSSSELRGQVLSEANARMLEALNQAGWFTRE